MSQFKIHNAETAPDGSKELLQGAQKQLGFIPNLYGIMADAPAALNAYNSINQIFESSSLDTTEKQIVLLATSFVNECHYCMAVHSTVGKMQNIDNEIIEALRNGEPIKDGKFEALRKFTQTVVEKRGWLDEAEIEAFLSAGYSKAQMLEVIVGIAQKTLSNYINHIVQTPLDDAFEPNKWDKVHV